MPIYKRGPNKYEVRIYVHGKPRAKILNPATKREAETFEARWRLELAAIAPSDDRSAPQFSTFCLGRYRIYAETRLKASTWKTRCYQLATLVEHFGHLRIDQITAVKVEEFQHAQLKAGLSAVRANDNVKVLLVILNYARSQNIPCHVPKVRRLPERSTTGRVKVWSEDDVTKLYAAIQVHAPNLLGIVVVMINCGLRKGEALALEWSSVDLERGLLKIWPSEEWQPKNGLPREVPIGRAALPWLTEPDGAGRFVFPSRKGTRYVVWPQRAFDRARVKAKVGGSPHVCRHTFASHFLGAVPDLFLLAAILGHSHTRVTALYAHLLPDHLERGRNAVELPAPGLILVG